MLLSVPGKVLNRLTTTLDAELIETCMQAGFRKDRSCTDHIVTFHITVEETLEWNSLLYVNFVDFQKAFDSLDRNSLWTLMRHYGIPEKLITIIQKLYRPLTCQIFHNGSLSLRTFISRYGSQTRLPTLTIIVPNGSRLDNAQNDESTQSWPQWTPWSQLDGLDFADDIALVPHNHKQMQQKITQVANTSAKLVLSKVKPSSCA